MIHLALRGFHRNFYAQPRAFSSFFFRKNRLTSKLAAIFFKRKRLLFSSLDFAKVSWVLVDSNH